MSQAHNIIITGRELAGKGLIIAGEGNFSARLDATRILATPGGLHKGRLKESDLVVLDLHGNHISGERKASSEIAMHLEAYRRRPDVNAVIHAHPPNCIALMLAGKGLDKALLAETVVFLGKIPTAPFAMPSTTEVPASINPFIKKTDCILLDRHGSLTMGENLQQAFDYLTTMEQTAYIYLQALQTGAEIKEISRAEIVRLMQLRKERYRLTRPIISFLE